MGEDGYGGGVKSGVKINETIYRGKASGRPEALPRVLVIHIPFLQSREREYYMECNI